MMSDAERLFRRATGLHRTGNGAGKGEADGVRELTMAISEEVQEARWPTPRRLPLMKRASG